MNRFLGYTFISFGLLGFLFFWNYKGTAIPLRELWFVLSSFLILAGSYFYAKYKLSKLNSQQGNADINRLAEIERLKRTGERIQLTLDNSEIKTRSYQKEIISDSLPSRIEVADALYDSNRNYKVEEIQQTYLVYYKQYNGKAYKFVSQATTQNAEAVKQYMDLQKGIELYIDSKNPTNYYFDLPWL